MRARQRSLMHAMTHILPRRLMTALLAGAAAMIVAACGGGDSPAEGRTAFERPDDRAKGDPGAPVTLIEYASVACGACAAYHQGAGETIDRLVEDGTLRFVFREMLTGQTQVATAGFMLARCADESEYFTMIDTLMEQQSAIFTAAGQPGGMRAHLQRIAGAAGLTEAQFQTCLQDESVFQAVRDANQQAVEDGIGATPTFILNGEVLASELGTDGAPIFVLDGEPLLIDGEPVPYSFEGATWERIILHVKQQAEAAG